MQLFVDLERSMAGVEELAGGSATDKLLGMGSDFGPSDLRNDVLDPATPTTPGAGAHVPGLLGTSLDKSIGSRMGRSGSRSGLRRPISTASLAAMESLRAEPEIWQVRHGHSRACTRHARRPCNPCACSWWPLAHASLSGSASAAALRRCSARPRLQRPTATRKCDARTLCSSPVFCAACVVRSGETRRALAQ
jgi:hypothetical protein